MLKLKKMLEVQAEKTMKTNPQPKMNWTHPFVKLKFSTEIQIVGTIRL